MELALALFDRVYVTREPGITFHPKMYLFKGVNHAQAFVGSNNLTVGGTEKNFEAGVHFKFDLPEDAADLAMLESAWSELLPESCSATVELDERILGQLVADYVVIEERAMGPFSGDGDRARVGRGERSGLPVKPESPLPKNIFTANRMALPRKPIMSPGAEVPRIDPSSLVDPSSAAERGFVIQIKPHHNGEIFLSYTAVQQNPQFFDWPFSGRTTPKNPKNPSYPQRDPDPLVNITVFGAGRSPVLIRPRYSLNTVDYERKREIRITASFLVGVVPEYSVMIMERSSESDISYDITIHTPESSDYQAWVDSCNQSMPGGGKEPRKYGWF